ncbi:MAG TPA: aminoglycoside phosphotransferase family protein [Candidatus Limnocylindria bacterium]|nr:aminoglycoside phosphotransferase family protein [Candidatus Limnocylindria bacterium]
MPPQPPPRTVTLVLVTPGGELVGALPPFEVESPWWPEAQPVVRTARDRHGLEVTILRLLEAPESWPGGAVTYLAEVESGGPAQPWKGRLDDHPLRMPWARPGGPAADMAWARRALADEGLRLAGDPEQIRSWNLSSLWRLPLEEGSAWFKSVPPFFEHEGRLLEVQATGPVPRLIAHDGRRMLLHEVPGEDLHEPTSEQLLRMVDQLVELQARWLGRSGELLALGLPDWRGPALAGAIGDVVRRVGTALPAGQRRVLDAFVAGLPQRLALLADCGLPDTLVHGDFHPGNHRGSGTDFVLLDWGDAGVGQPLLDEQAMLERVPGAQGQTLRRHWQRLWHEVVPGSDPLRAAFLLAPVAAARQAVIYQKFLDNIEPSEHPYHRHDPADWLRRTAQLLTRGAGR